MACTQRLSPMARAALFYGARGFAVLPIKPDTKEPACEHGVHSATTAAPKIRRWWVRRPDALLAVRCDWFWVLDIDPRSGGDRTLAGWLAQHGALPGTWTARSGSGGAHYYFRHERCFEAIPLGKLAQGIDVKGNGKHYVLAAPSRTKSGPYRWLVSPRAPLARAPRWLVDLIVATKTPPAPAPTPDIGHRAGDRRVERARRYAQALPPAVAGSNGHGTTFRAAVLIGRGFGLTEDEAVAVLSEWNQSCVPPWSERELRRKVREALRCGSMPFGALVADYGRRAA